MSNIKAVGILAEILKEREEQIAKHNHLVDDDDKYHLGQLARAGAAYALHSTGARHYRKEASRLYPWSGINYNKTQREQLVIAAAFLVAEIERLDRLTTR